MKYMLNFVNSLRYVTSKISLDSSDEWPYTRHVPVFDLFLINVYFYRMTENISLRCFYVPS